jgi:hypothetical protein
MSNKNDKLVIPVSELSAQKVTEGEGSPNTESSPKKKPATGHSS